MLNLIIGVFMVLHGLVHLLYFGQSWRLFELQPAMVWPDGSWVFSKFVGDDTTRMLASVLLVFAAIGFVIGGIGIFARQDWWRTVVVGTAAFSAILFILLWDGKMHGLDNSGGVGLLINFAILAALLFLKWPRFQF